uniref:Uncharacterized protein n=2 Tax=Oryza sativa subsp. japonica TaxID=39947 RepID=Q8LNF0_ORYSJ|nr:hypothetical protein [Oryza sativa Japonica Group]
MLRSRKSRVMVMLVTAALLLTDMAGVSYGRRLIPDLDAMAVVGGSPPAKGGQYNPSYQNFKIVDPKVFMAAQTLELQSRTTRISSKCMSLFSQSLLVSAMEGELWRTKKTITQRRLQRSSSTSCQEQEDGLLSVLPARRMKLPTGQCLKARILCIIDEVSSC